MDCGRVEVNVLLLFDVVVSVIVIVIMVMMVVSMVMGMSLASFVFALVIGVLFWGARLARAVCFFPSFLNALVFVESNFGIIIEIELGGGLLWIIF